MEKESQPAQLQPTSVTKVPPQITTSDKITYLPPVRKTLILLVKDQAFHYGNGFSIPITQSSFPYAKNKLKPNTCWKTEIVEYNEDEKIALLKVVDYEVKTPDPLNDQHPKTLLKWFNFEPFEQEAVEQCLFQVYRKTLLPHCQNGARMLRRLEEGEKWELRPKPLNTTDFPDVDADLSPKITETIQKEIDYPIKKIRFEEGSAAFKIGKTHFHGLKDSGWYSVAADNIRPEFQPIAHYIIRALRQKQFKVTITIAKWSNWTYSVQELKVPELGKIDGKLIQKAQYYGVQSELKGFRNGNPGRIFASPLEILDQDQEANGLDEMAFLNEMLQDHPEVHFHELSFLAKQQFVHRGVGLRFVLHPHPAFLFTLLLPQTAYLVLETYKVDLATYIWRFPDPPSSSLPRWLRQKQSETEREITQIDAMGRNRYRSLRPENFEYVEHQQGKDGFRVWRERFESIVPMSK